jgi:hypothetical protein
LLVFPDQEPNSRPIELEEALSNTVTILNVTDSTLCRQLLLGSLDCEFVRLPSDIFSVDVCLRIPGLGLEKITEVNILKVMGKKT